jgi:hypothetical protein
MAAPFATPADIAAIWRPLTAAEETTAEVLVDVASTIVRERFPTIDARLAAGALSPLLARQVVAGMVRRYLEVRGPDIPIEEQAGPFRERWSPPQAAALALTRDDAALLTPPARRRRSSIPLGLGIAPP